METAQRIPPVVIPFAMVGLGAGWLAAGLVRTLGSAVTEAQPVAAACGAVAGVILGALVTSRARKLTWVEQPRSVMGYLFWLLPLAVMCAAAITAALVGSPAPLALETGLAVGVPTAVVVLPICRLVLNAAIRATRARMGSIVAASDRRAILRYTLAPLGVCTALGAVDWPAIATHIVHPPWISLAMAAGTLGGLLALVAADARALRRLNAIARQRESDAEPLHTTPGRSIERIDFGVGDDIREELKAGGPAYRSRGQVARLLLGDADMAVAALQKAIRGGIAATVLGAAGLAAHFVAPTPLGSSLFHGIRCERGSSWDCQAMYALRMGQPVPGHRAPRVRYGPWAF
jgi:hypothetical protein